MTQNRDVAIIGAGPYGLSLAAHLRARNVPFRIFGDPMRPWADNMPPGMFLKSDGASSSLSDADGSLSIRRFHEENALPFQVESPIPVERFIAYGRAFQARYVPGVEKRAVVEVAREADGYLLRLDDGQSVRAARVVIAVGVLPFHHTPASLGYLPRALLSHSSAYGPVDAWRGREVVVIGSGASAIDLAAALHEGGAGVRILSHRDAIAFHSPPGPRSLLSRIRKPDSAIGAGWRIKFCADLPGLFHALPERDRVRIVTTYLGAAPGWFMRDRILGKIPILCGVTPIQAAEQGGKVRLLLAGRGGTTQEIVADHAVAATGYRVDIARLAFIKPELARKIRTTGTAPALSRHFETSVPGLHIIGPAAAMSFGPVMRFVYGAEFTASRLSEHLARSMRARPVAAAGGGEVALSTNTGV